MNLKSIILGKRSQTQKITYGVIRFLLNIQNRQKERQKADSGGFPGSPCLGLCASTAESTGSIPDQGTKIPNVTSQQNNQTNKTPKQIHDCPQLGKRRMGRD